MRIITKELAEKIAVKLKATIIEKRSAHDRAEIYEDGKLIAWFGIRRGSSKDQGHDHIPERLYISSHDAKQLGQCPLSREEWICKLKEKGLA